MTKATKKQILLLIFILITAVSFLLFFDFGKNDLRTTEEILNSGHLPLFGVIALSLLWVLNSGSFSARSKKNYILSGLITIIFGISSECVQYFLPYREFELGDILSDILGAITFLSIAYTYNANLSPRKRVTIRCLSVSLIALSFLRILPAAMDDWHMMNDLPLLCSFESFLETSRWQAGEGNDLERITEHATDGKHALKVILSSGKYPGISMEHHPGDWTGYKALTFDVFLEGTIPLKATVRIDDKTHNQRFNDRYNGGFLLQPGPNHISVDLDQVGNSPNGRAMDMAQINTFSIFTSGLKDPRTLYFDNFRLEK